MSFRDRSGRAATIAVSTFAFALAGPAFAYDQPTCLASYEQAQKDRIDHHLRLAREQLLVCAHVTCPNVVARDCRQWRNEVEDDMASISVVARDARGNDVRDVKMSVDGDLILEELDDKPIFVEAGVRTFRFERRGSIAVEQKIGLRRGERLRGVEVKFASAAPDDAPASDHLKVPLASVDVSRSEGEGSPRSTVTSGVAPDAGGAARSPGTVVYVLGGIGIVGLGAFAYFGFTGESDVTRLREDCSPRCAKDDVDAARTKLIAANVSLGVGLASLGAAAVLWLSGGAASSHATTLVDYRPLAGGGVGEVVGRF